MPQRIVLSTRRKRRAIMTGKELAWIFDVIEFVAAVLATLSDIRFWFLAWTILMAPHHYIAGTASFVTPTYGLWSNYIRTKTDERLDILDTDALWVFVVAFEASLIVTGLRLAVDSLVRQD